MFAKGRTMIERRGGPAPSRFETPSAFGFTISGGLEAQPIEAIAFSRHGDDETRLLRIGLDLSPQLPDQHVHAAVERLEPPMGEGVHESVAANHPPWPTDEHPQHSKLAACERDSLAGFAGKDAGVEVEDEPGEPQ